MGCKKILKFTCLTIKFHNSNHTNVLDYKASNLTLSLGAWEEPKGLEVVPGGRIPAAIAAAEGGGRTAGLPLTAAAAGDLLRSRLFFRGILILTY